MKTNKRTNKQTKNISTRVVIVAGGIVFVTLLLAVNSKYFFGSSFVGQAIKPFISNLAHIGFNNPDDSSMILANESGAQIQIDTGANILPPDNWPADIPVKEGAKIVYSNGANLQSGQTGAMITMLIAETVNAVADFYKTELASNDWMIETVMQTTEGSMIGATKNSHFLSVFVTRKDSDSTQITLTVTTD